MTLYELSEQYQNLLAMIDEIPEDAFADTLEALEGEIEDKIDGIVSVMKTLTAEAEAITREKESLEQRIKSKQKHVERLESYLKDYMGATGRVRVETPRNMISIAQCSPKVVIDESFYAWAIESKRIDLLKPVVEPKPEADKAAIKKALQDGATIPFAHLEHGVALRFK